MHEDILQIVIIDDEYFFRQNLIKEINWKRYGFHLAGDANNGIAGLELIKRIKPDIAIVDINMPGLTGLEMIQQLADTDIDCCYCPYLSSRLRLSAYSYLTRRTRNW